jgi:hypothetical protein
MLHVVARFIHVPTCYYHDWDAALWAPFGTLTGSLQTFRIPLPFGVQTFSARRLLLQAMLALPPHAQHPNSTPTIYRRPVYSSVVFSLILYLLILYNIV